MKIHKPKITRAAMYGLAGDVVQALLPHTESDESALYCQLLAYFGNIIGRTAYFKAEASKHHTNLFILLIGLSSKGRKGSSLNQIHSLFEDDIFKEWRSESICKGLSSGEGLIHRVSDLYGIDQKQPFPIRSEASVSKSLLCIETEFGSVLQNMTRQGNTLSNVLRQAWDGSKLETLTKHNPLKSEAGHISVIGHITFEELKATLNPIDIKNGLGNRFLFFCTERSKKLPEGSAMNESEKKNLQTKIKEAYMHAINLNEVPFDENAKLYWVSLYEALSAEKVGIINDLSGRAEAQVRRIALILAVMNKEYKVSAECLGAAVEIWSYCQNSVRYIFGESFGNATLDKIIYILQEAGPDGRTKTELNDDFKRNQNLNSFLEFLEEKEYIIKIVTPTGKRPTISYKISEKAFL